VSDIILVAFEVPDHDPRPFVQGMLAGSIMPVLKMPGFDSWWIAEDERYDRSDNDSAVFVPMGQQNYWRGRIKHLLEFPPCSSCGSEHMDTEMCPNIKSECTDCCGCPDHGPVKVPGLLGFNVEFDGNHWEGHLVNDFAQALSVISSEFDKAGDERRITSIEFTYEGDES